MNKACTPPHLLLSLSNLPTISVAEIIVETLERMLGQELVEEGFPGIFRRQN